MMVDKILANKYEEYDRNDQEIEGEVDDSVLCTVFLCYLFYMFILALFSVIHVPFDSLFCCFFSFCFIHIACVLCDGLRSV